VAPSPDLASDRTSDSDTANGGGTGAGLTVLGQRTEYHYDRPDQSTLEAFENPYPGSPWVVSLLCSEFTSLCPITGQPDYGRLIIDYVPGRLCVESKSLKLYLVGFRNHGSFHEACVNKVADDLSTKLSPRYLRVYGDFKPRGGIAIRPLAARAAPDLGADELARCLSLLNQVDAYSRAGEDRQSW
jgi:7-cyano-7-deazaguanine reductase